MKLSGVIRFPGYDRIGLRDIHGIETNDDRWIFARTQLPSVWLEVIYDGEDYRLQGKTLHGKILYSTPTAGGRYEFRDDDGSVIRLEE